MAEQEAKPPFPPFTEESARKKVKTAQDSWNTKLAFPATARCSRSLSAPL